MTSLNPVYVFFLRDHLGSVRSVVTENGAVLDRSGNRFRFSGKELSSEGSLLLTLLQRSILASALILTAKAIR